MNSKKYTLLIIDDEWSSRKSDYEKILGGEEGFFDLKFVRNQMDLERDIRENRVSAYVIDIFLENNGWEMLASDVINSYVKGKKEAPVFLVSSKWGEYEQVRSEIQTLWSAHDLIQGFFAWDSFRDVTKSELPEAETTKSLKSEILTKLDAWHGRSYLHLDSAKTLRILHISDTQFKDPLSDPKAHGVEAAIRRGLRRDNCSPDIVLISGDIAYSGRPSEYLEAEKWIDRLMNTLWPGEKERAFGRLFLVPGNHDVNLGICALDECDYQFGWDQKGDVAAIPFAAKESPGAEYHTLGLEPFFQFAERIELDRQWRANSPHLCRVSERFQHLGVQFLLANTAARIDARKPSRAGIPKEAIDTMTDLAYTGDDGDSMFRVLVSHHGPQVWADEWEKDDWDRFEGMISHSRIDLWLCGHNHGYKEQVLGKPSARPGLPVILSPSLNLKSEALDTEERRGFVLIELERKNGMVTKSRSIHYEIHGHEVDQKECSEKWGRIKD